MTSRSAAVGAVLLSVGLCIAVAMGFVAAAVPHSRVPAEVFLAAALAFAGCGAIGVGLAGIARSHG